VKKFSFILISIYFIILGCNNNPSIHSSHIEKNGFWLKNNPINANVEIRESPVDIYLVLKLNDEYPFSNIHLLSKLENNDVKIIDTISYNFNDSKNRTILSKQIRIKTFKIPIFSNIDTKGETLIEVTHAVRFIDSIKPVIKLEGILDVGILINKSNEKI
tara:strand:+ start:1329 stop:1808 length:480 start_codon:yes stop_codon:yes gene_type:complete